MTDRPSGPPRFDETADVESIRESAREAWLVISSAAGVRTIPLPRQPRIVIGRLHTCDIVIEDESVSRQHAALINPGNGLSIEDLGSRNKTKIMGRSLGRGVPAVPGANAANVNPNDLRAQRESWERQQIVSALEKTSGNQKEAAILLGVSRRTLINKIEAYGIARPRKR